jgi:hypothetical protein
MRLLATLLIFLSMSNLCAQSGIPLYRSVMIDQNGQLHISLQSGRPILPPKLPTKWRSVTRCSRGTIEQLAGLEIIPAIRIHTQGNSSCTGLATFSGSFLPDKHFGHGDSRTEIVTWRFVTDLCTAVLASVTYAVLGLVTC